MSEPFTVRVLKYDGSEYRRWNARLRRREDSLILLDAEFEEEITHEALGTIPCGTRTLEYYWLDRWYNIFQFLNADDSTLLFYCNINLPPKLQPGELTYIDLDIDVLVQPDLTYEILDLEDFETSCRKYVYPEDLQLQAQSAVQNLVERIENRRFPFANSV